MSTETQPATPEPIDPEFDVRAGRVASSFYWFRGPDDSPYSEEPDDAKRDAKRDEKFLMDEYLDGVARYEDLKPEAKKLFDAVEAFNERMATDDENNERMNGPLFAVASNEPLTDDEQKQVDEAISLAKADKRDDVVEFFESNRTASPSDVREMLAEMGSEQEA